MKISWSMLITTATLKSHEHMMFTVQLSSKSTVDGRVFTDSARNCASQKGSRECPLKT